MKLIASSFSISTILAADFAQISYRLQEAANELAPIFLNDLSSFPTEIFNHGCWCAKLNALPSAGLGGHPVDELDGLCKDWAKARRCSRSDGGSCETASSLVLSTAYELEYDFSQGATGTQLCPDADTCLTETCQIDSHYINLIRAWRTANPGNFYPDSNPTCENHGSNAALVCEPFPTTARPVSQQDIADALTNAGVDNTGKSLALTLVWAGANRCDFDLVAIDPSGEKTYYANSPSSNGGTLDVDQRGREAVNVENISWATAPPSGNYEVQVWAYGACVQPDFTLYVNMDGATSTFEGTSNGSRQSVTTFSFGGNSNRNFVGRYSGPAQEYGPKQY